jgi:hypothetical protein
MSQIQIFWPHWFIDGRLAGGLVRYGGFQRWLGSLGQCHGRFGCCWHCSFGFCCMHCSFGCCCRHCSNRRSNRFWYSRFWYSRFCCGRFWRRHRNMGWCRFNNNGSRLRTKEMKFEGVQIDECSTTNYHQDTDEYPRFLFGRDAHFFLSEAESTFHTRSADLPAYDKLQRLRWQ